MIRLILIVIFAIIIFFASLIMLPVFWLIGKFNQDAKDRGSLRFVQGVFKVVLFLSGVTTTVKGLENLPKDGEAVLFVGNHHGFFDTIISYTYMKPRTGFVAKKEIEKVPLLNIWMKYLYCLFLDRKNMKEGLKTILTGIDYLKAGTSIVIFPEGTRNKSIDGVLPFHAGSFKLAEKSGCRIIPIVQNNTAAALEDHLPFFKKTHTVLEFGKPIDVASMDREHYDIALKLPSGGTDTGYPGMVWHKDELWISYYSAHEDKNGHPPPNRHVELPTAIYLARVRLTK